MSRLVLNVASDDVEKMMMVHLMMTHKRLKIYDFCNALQDNTRRRGAPFGRPLQSQASYEKLLRGNRHIELQRLAYVNFYNFGTLNCEVCIDALFVVDGWIKASKNIF